MRVLLDTHVLLWVANSRQELSSTAREVLGEERHSFYISAVSAWEIATKHRLGKLHEAAGLVADFEKVVTLAGYRLLPITCAQGLAAGGFTGDHKDPFDRLLAAQALLEDMVLLSSDKALDTFDIRRIW